MTLTNTLRIGVVSDLHLDGCYSLPNPRLKDVDAFVVAGDFCNGLTRARHGPREHQGTLKYLRQAPKPLVAVLGNHDYYNQDPHLPDAMLPPGSERMAEVLESVEGVTVLRTGVILDLKGIRFIGCTWWSGLSWQEIGCTPELLRQGVGTHISDPQNIYPYHDFVDRMLLAHLDHTQWLLQAVDDAIAQGLVPVVVTHFCPNRRSIHPKYKGQFLNPYFCNDLPDSHPLFEKVPLWIHGHTHSSFDYILNKCRVVCNPRGYGKGENPEYDSAKIVEVVVPVLDAG